MNDSIVVANSYSYKEAAHPQMDSILLTARKAGEVAFRHMAALQCSSREVGFRSTP